ncbi:MULTISPECIES: peptidoglycan DD-metalloendopeptidase family protein [unclassified Leptolyngbya]|uniref:murein hydrolase activator EnvC family protein n=1 Tax=unclassified Leptolyngbya TaxID=2650499 RepID=UPI00322077F2
MGVVVCGVWLGAVPAFALPAQTIEVAQANQSIDELRQQRQEIDQQRQRLERERNQLLQQEKSAKNRLDGLQDQIKTTADEVRRNEQQLKAAEARLKALEAELAKAEDQFQKQQTATVARLQFLQRQQGSQGWAVLLNSQNINEFLERRSQLRRVYKSDRDFLDHLKTIAEDINRRHAAVEQQKNEIALISQQLLARKAVFEAQAKTQEQLVNRLNQDRKALEVAENQLERDSNNIAGLIRQRLSLAAGSRLRVRGTGIFSLPCSAPLTSGFGYRVHPILGYRRFHAGVDFGAAYGSTIYSADRGTVIFAGWYGGYGRAVIIDHGDSLTTLYGHASRVFVQEGQSVERGQAIAAVGSTGLSTGPHLHFEVRRNGEPVNPLEYL